MAGFQKGSRDLFQSLADVADAEVPNHFPHMRRNRRMAGLALKGLQVLAKSGTQRIRGCWWHGDSQRT
jgi:hypothetical protein